MSLLLASKSAARRHMLEAAGVKFESCEAPLDEEAAKAEIRATGAGARELAAGLAERKALSVTARDSDLVLGADQTLERGDGSMLDKPASYDEAFAQLRSLSGTAHRLHAAASIAQAGAIRWRRTATVTLHVRPLTDAFLRSYLDAEYETIRYNVGGYRIEGPGVQLFSRIEGSHFAIMGLPLLPLLGYLRRRGLLKT
jgi:nucleoside triphosphate pyrophosphatase